MRVFHLGAIPHRMIDAHDSIGFSVGALGISADAHLVVVRLKPGGTIGGHPAPGRQLLLVIDGDATVTGGQGDQRTVGPGEAAVWEAGEQHTTSSVNGLLGFLVEGDLDLDTRPGAVDAP
ncbi:quercetin dioxygenase-like cupin family protein [Nocardioides daedukensis]|uniref:Quercetin dioxygenase-like cupin family protein n=1 Tax=Nocardioides daedukensis TaxID=634462 RepID=A0A7Y9RW32_9ACTN|nr:quercetin dioxygenase-like cupin family protein [Nocardioides daedukensis]